MTTTKKSLRPSLKAMEALLARDEEQFANLGDHLQIMEMSSGYAHMMKSPDYRKYRALKIRCQKLRNAIAAAGRPS
jgi:hypothetical protein